MPPIRLTEKTLQELKDKGFQFVIVKGYTPERRLDHIQLNYFTLVPLKELPTGPGEKEIYAPIDSEVLAEWANLSDGFEAYIEMTT
jgi:hypothetical protein